MTVGISLIRGINVGGRNMVRMEALRAAHDALGLAEAQTYVQSGNVVFRTRLRDLSAIGRRIEDSIQRSHGFRPGVMVRTAAELRGVIARNPFAERSGIEPAKLVVGFLASQPDNAAGEKLRGIRAGPEEFYLSGRELYIYFPDGMGRSKFTTALIERALKTASTARNWNTVTKLMEMAEALES